MMGKLPYTVLRAAAFTHPMMAEGLGRPFGRVSARTQANASTGPAAKCREMVARIVEAA